MTTINYIEFDGTRHAIDVEEQMTLMEGATLNMVPGVEGMCGGLCSCATCHVYIPDAWAAKIPALEDGEDVMLNDASERKGSSRLGCQVVVTSELEGMEVHLPETQG